MVFRNEEFDCLFLKAPVISLFVVFSLFIQQTAKALGRQEFYQFKIVIKK
jgi:hypothetical protein